MLDLMIIGSDFNAAAVCIRLIVSFLLGGIIGLERGRHGRAAGLRTHILVSIGATMTSLMSIYVYNILGDAGDVFRIPAQVISGIGFLGAGTILIRNKSVVMGLTTAAGILCTAAIGIAVGYGFYLGAVICTMIEIITTTLLSLLERNEKQMLRFYAEISYSSTATDVIRRIRDVFPESSASVDIIAPKSGSSGSLGLTVSVKDNISGDEYIDRLKQIESVVFAAEEDI